MSQSVQRDYGPVGLMSCLALALAVALVFWWCPATLPEGLDPQHNMFQFSKQSMDIRLFQSLIGFTKHGGNHIFPSILLLYNSVAHSFLHLSSQIYMDFMTKISMFLALKNDIFFHLISSRVLLSCMNIKE